MLCWGRTEARAPGGGWAAMCSILSSPLRWKKPWLKEKIWTIPSLFLARSRGQVTTCEQSLLVCKQWEWDGSWTFCITLKWHRRQPRGIRVRRSVRVNTFCSVIALSPRCYLMLTLMSVKGIKTICTVAHLILSQDPQSSIWSKHLWNCVWSAVLLLLAAGASMFFQISPTV